MSVEEAEAYVERFPREWGEGAVARFSTKGAEEGMALVRTVHYTTPGVLQTRLLRRLV